MALRCPACSATNPDKATWCNQCLRDLALRSDLRGQPLAVDHSAPRAPVPDPPADAALRRTGSGVEWRCPACAGWSSIEDDACARCQTPFRTHLEAAAAPGRPRRPAVGTGGVDVDAARTRAVALNAVLPGLGHVLVGWVGSGLARIVLFLVWVVGGLLLTSAGGVVAALPLFLGAAILWLAGLFDGWQVVTGARQVLSGRALLWLVVGVTLLATISVVASIVAGPA